MMKHKTAILCAGFGALLMLGGCSGSAKQAYIATDGDIQVGVGQYPNGEFVKAACDFTTGKVNITSTHITSGIPLKLNPKYAQCDTASHKLIVPVSVSGKKAE